MMFFLIVTLVEKSYFVNLYLCFIIYVLLIICFL